MQNVMTLWFAIPHEMGPASEVVMSRSVRGNHYFAATQGALLCRIWLGRTVAPQNLFNLGQAALSSMVEGRLTLGINRCNVGPGVDQQFRHLAAIVLLRGVHDQRRHAVEF